MNRKRRLFLLYFVLPVALCLCSAWRIVPDLRQQWQNNQLIAAIQRNDTPAVTALLAQGADPNARGFGNADTLSFWQFLRLRFSRKPSNPVTKSAFRIALNRLSLHTGASFSPSYNANIDIVTLLLQKGAAFDLRPDFSAQVYKGHFHHGDKSPYVDLEELCKGCAISGDLGEFVGTEQQTDALIQAAVKAGARRK